MKYAILFFVLLTLFFFGLGFVKNPMETTEDQMEGRMMFWLLAIILAIISGLLMLIHLFV